MPPTGHLGAVIISQKMLHDPGQSSIYLQSLRGGGVALPAREQSV